MFITDEFGKWQVLNGIKLLIEPSQKWIDENQSEEPINDPQWPTQEERLQALEEAFITLTLGGI